MTRSLDGKRALITGGSRGIGAAVVGRLAREGADVALTYVSRPDQADAVASAARTQGVLGRSGRRVTIAASAEQTRDRRVQDAFFIVEPQRVQLARAASMIDAGELRPIVGAVFPLADARRAYRHEPVHGKVVLAIVA